MSPRLKRYGELATGGVLPLSHASRPETGGWRTEGKPVVRLDKCVDCLLCWVNCPDSAVLLTGTDFFGFDYDYCKGCALCVEICPVKAIELIAEGVTVPDYGRLEEAVV